MKICSQCNREKEESSFPNNKFTKSGYRSICKTCSNSNNKLWRINNPNYYNTYYKLHTPRRLLIGKKYREQHKETIKEKRLTKYKENIPKYLIRSSKIRSKKNNMIHTINESDIIIPTHCPVLGIPLFYKRTGGLPNNNSPSIDRIDNNKGYTKDNIVIVSRRANVLKNNATLEELEKIVAFYKGLQHG